MKWWIWVVLGMWIVVLVSLGCSPTSDPGGPGDDPISRDTPSHLLNWLAVAYSEKDTDAYDEALHDSFLFVFTKDIAEDLGLPPEQPWWGKTRDVAGTAKMFGSSEVTQIIMDYVSDARWDTFDVERPDGSTFSGVWAEVEPDIRVTVEDPGQEPMIYVVNESWLHVYVVPDPDPQYEGLWVFLEIQELLKNPE